MYLNRDHLLSVVIPAYNEEHRIGATLEVVCSFLKEQPYRSEVIVVDDGSRDNTKSIVLEYQTVYSRLKYIALEKNYGKGKAVQQGMVHAEGDFRLFMDADNSTSIEQVNVLLEKFGENYDVVVGSRKLPDSHIQTKQNIIRELLGWLFRVISYFILPVSVWDTQNGFKAFTKQAAITLFTRQKTHGWAFDIELLWNAKKLNLKVAEVPVVWVNDEGSKVTVPAMFLMLVDLFKTRFKH